MKEYRLVFLLLLWLLAAALVLPQTPAVGAARYVLAAIVGAVLALLGYAITNDKGRVSVRIKTALGVFIVLVAALTFMFGLETLWALIVNALVLFLPGLALSYLFFTNEELDLLERMGFSFALALVIMPLLVFYLQVAGVHISALIVWIVALLVSMAAFALYKRKEVLYASRRRRSSAR